MKKILIVENSFEIEGRGLIVAGRKTKDFIESKVGDSIAVETSKNNYLDSKIKGLGNDS